MTAEGGRSRRGVTGTKKEGGALPVTRSIRIFELVHLLSGKRGRRVSEIARRFGVSERTVFRDLADLQERHIPVYHDETGYHLMDTASLPPLNLTAREHALLKVALHNPALRKQPTLARTLEALEGKLDAASRHAEEHPRALQLAPIDRSGPKAEKALELLSIAINRCQPVEIRYASLSGGTDKRRGLDPWQLFQRAGAWYVIGRCHIHAEPRIFRLDRVGDVTGLERTFTLPSDFDLDRHLDDAWSMVSGHENHKVTLRFNKSLAPLILNARHHPGEQIKQFKNGNIEYRVELSSLEEIARWVVGFGGKCRVVGPKALKERVWGLAEGVVGET